jgi:hypothetical protein
LGKKGAPARLAHQSPDEAQRATGAPLIRDTSPPDLNSGRNSFP